MLFTRDAVVVITVLFNVASAALDLSRPIPIFLKFHKVGSQSVKSYFEITQPNLITFWRGNLTQNDLCPQDPWSHRTLILYRAAGKKAFKRCFNIREKFKITYVTIMRNPLDRLVSSLYFFHWKLREIILQFHDKDAISVGKKLYEKLTHNRSTEITVDEMRVAFRIMNETGRFDLLTNEYEVTLSKYSKVVGFNSNQETQQAALLNMKREVGVAGITESLPSFFVLLSKYFNLPLSAACNLHLNHGAQMRYSEKIFNKSSRPPPASLFTSEVIAYMNSAMRGEYTLWDYAKSLHELQLAQHGLTLQEATALWKQSCPEELKML